MDKGTQKKIFFVQTDFSEPKKFRHPIHFTPPTMLKYAKGLLDKDNRYQIEIIDCSIENISVDRLILKVLQALADQGNTVALIEHNMEIIKEADYIIDLGPEGGDEGGHVVAAGSPMELLAHPNGSHTARHLRTYLGLAHPSE